MLPPKLITVLALFAFCACKEKMTDDEIATIGTASCRVPAAYIAKIGFNPQYAAYSTEAIQNYKGIMLLQSPTNRGDTNMKIWQHSSWSKYGNMGSITTDDKGNAYTAPIPFVNTLDYTLATINQIYKIENETGEMKPYLKLPMPDSAKGVVPFGVLGVYYDCHGQKLYASSVAGSTRDEEKGVIYVVDTKDGKVVDELKGYDACGLMITGVTGTKKLFFGSARTSDIFTIELSKEGLFVGKPSLELSLDGLGPRGNDIARRIRTDKQGMLNIYGIEFTFSLVAPSKKPETFYQFGYDKEAKKWFLYSSK